MATSSEGEIVQVVGYMESGTTVEISDSQGQANTWNTPTSGNTLIALLASGTTISSMTGWTQRYSAGNNIYRYIYEKTSDGTETTITATFSSTEDHMMFVYEIGGAVTYDTSVGGETASGTSVSSGSSGTLDESRSLALAMCMHWNASDTPFTNDYSLDLDSDDSSNSELYYCSCSHKLLGSTAATSTTGSWDDADQGQTFLGVWSIGAAHDNVVQSVAKTYEQSVTSSFVVTLWSTPVEDNALIAICQGGQNWNPASSISGSGWTELYDAQGSDPPYSTYSVYYKVAGSSEPTTITVSNPEADAGFLAVLELSGIDDADLFEDSNVANSGTTGTSQNTGDVTAPADGALLIASKHMWNTNGIQNFTQSTDWTEVFDVNSDSTGGTNEMQGSVAVRKVTSSGDYSNTFSWTDASTYGLGTAIIVAFNLGEPEGGGSLLTFMQLIAG